MANDLLGERYVLVVGPPHYIFVKKHCNKITMIMITIAQITQCVMMQTRRFQIPQESVSFYRIEYIVNKVFL